MGFSQKWIKDDFVGRRPRLEWQSFRPLRFTLKGGTKKLQRANDTDEAEKVRLATSTFVKQLTQCQASSESWLIDHKAGLWGRTLHGFMECMKTEDADMTAFIACLLKTSLEFSQDVDLKITWGFLSPGSEAHRSAVKTPLYGGQAWQLADQGRCEKERRAEKGVLRHCWTPSATVLLLKC